MDSPVKKVLDAPEKGLSLKILKKFNVELFDRGKNCSRLKRSVKALWIGERTYLGGEKSSFSLRQISSSLQDPVT